MNSLRTRWLLLGAGLLATTAASVGVLHVMQHHELAESVGRARLAQTESLERLLELSGRALKSYSEDYSQWDEMLEFTRTRDPEWAGVNIAAPFPRFNLAAVWVLDPAGALIYGHASQGAAPGLPAAVFPALVKQPFQHFFWDAPGGMLEIRTAPVQSSDDLTRTGPAQGYLVAARRWDEALLGRLAALVGHAAEFSLSGSPVPPPVPNERLSLAYPLPGLDDRPAGQLHLAIDHPAAEGLERYNPLEILLVAGNGLLALGLVGFLVHWWVMRPFQRIASSLETGQLAPVEPLLDQSGEFGRIARLIASSHADRDLLRSYLDERTRLGRDLHDGVIQALYASGLGLASVRRHLPAGAEDATGRLDQVCAQLNRTIRELRAFITSLEGEAMPQPSFRDVLEATLAAVRQAGDIETEAAIDERLASLLPHPARMDILQIAREAVSNALRHADATRITLALRPDGAGRAVLEINDDGVGYVPAPPGSATASSGRGLHNMAERARALGGVFEIRGQPGNGTRVRVHFALSAGR